MKLLNKTSIYYLLFLLPLFAVFSMLIYFFIAAEIKEEVDESLLKERGVLEQKLNDRRIDPNSLNTDETSITYFSGKSAKLLYFSDANIYDSTEAETVRYRMLTSTINVKSGSYMITIQRSYVETQDLVFSILVPIIVLFIVLLTGFFFINYWISKRLWTPFYETIEKLQTFELNNNRSTTFGTERIEEFNTLNQSLNSMTHKAYTDYIKQKEFTENASHEIQTPLAIISNKIEILIQSNKLGDEEMEIISGIYDSANRLSHLNKTLLLLTKIENNQFTDNSIVNLREVVNKSISIFSEQAEYKNITIKKNLADELLFKINPTLAETLFNNLVLNAIRHNIENGNIEIHLYKNQFTIFNTGAQLNTATDTIFERFKKGNTSNESIGLGLSIVKSICSIYSINVTYHYEKGNHVFTLNW